MLKLILNIFPNILVNIQDFYRVLTFFYMNEFAQELVDTLSTPALQGVQNY